MFHCLSNLGKCQRPWLLLSLSPKTIRLVVFETIFRSIALTLATPISQLKHSPGPGSERWYRHSRSRAPAPSHHSPQLRCFEVGPVALSAELCNLPQVSFQQIFNYGLLTTYYCDTRMPFSPFTNSLSLLIVIMIRSKYFKCSFRSKIKPVFCVLIWESLNS